MARIVDSQGRIDENSGYVRLFGNNQLGKLFSRVQAAVIRTGNELEELLWAATPYKASLADILGTSLFSGAHPILVTTAKGIAAANKSFPRTDILILDSQRGVIEVVELKDGDTFDTKKSAGELASAQQFTAWLEPQVTLPVRYYFCSFNQPDKQVIVKGVKNKFSIDQVMNGQELCARIGVDFEDIRLLRRRDQVENREYFIKQLLAIPDVRELVRQYLEEEGRL